MCDSDSTPMIMTSCSNVFSEETNSFKLPMLGQIFVGTQELAFNISIGLTQGGGHDFIYRKI